MNSGRIANQKTKMKGNLNDGGHLTDIYLPRKCDYSDQIIPPTDKSSIHLSICEVNADGTIDLTRSHIIPISGFVRQKGNGDSALEAVLKEKHLY
jgi:small subunit ribosomal protein S21e